MRTTRWVWWLVVATAACGVLEAIVMRAAGMSLLSVQAIHNAFPAINVATVVGGLVGAVILSRHPQHPIGWLFVWGQFGVAVGLLARAAADGITAGGLGISPGAWGVLDLGANLLGSQFALILFGCLLLLAPDGQPLSRRWRLAIWLLLASYALIAAGLFVRFVAKRTSNPIQLGEAGGNVSAVGEIGVLVGLILSVVALLLRLRRSSGETRQQLRWITVSAGLLASAPLLAIALNLSGRPTPVWVLVILHLGYLGVPVATGFALMRYRLYDVDRIVGGSVVLAVLVVLSFAGYVLAVGLAGTLLPGAAASTWTSLVIFVLVVLIFQPIRHTVRRLADRAVYGPQAMSYDALTAFTRELAGSGVSVPFLDGVAEAAARLVSADGCEAVLTLGDGTERAASWSSRSTPAASGANLVVPVMHAGETVGRLMLTMPEFAAGSGRRRELLAQFCQRVAPGFDHARLEVSLRTHAERLEQTNQELVKSRARLLAAKDIGRRQVASRISREVVDRLAPVTSNLEHVMELVSVDQAAAGREVDTALTATAQAIEQLRQITSTVFSKRLVERGLVDALGAEVWEPGVSLEVTGPALRWSPDVESCFFACCVDLVRGLRGQVSLELSQLERPLVAQLTLGFAAAPPDPDWLAGAVERIEVLGGRVDLLPSGQVLLRLPVTESEHPVSSAAP